MINYLYLCHFGPIGLDMTLLSDYFVPGRVTKMNIFTEFATFFTRDALEWIPSEINQNNEACPKQGCEILPLTFWADWLTSNDLLGENTLESHFCPRRVYMF